MHIEYKPYTKVNKDVNKLRILGFAAYNLASVIHKVIEIKGNVSCFL